MSQSQESPSQLGSASPESALQPETPSSAEPVEQSSSAAKSDPVVSEAPQRDRFEIRVGGDLAGFTVYRVDGERYAFVHTEIDSRFAGGGLGSVLIRGALDDVRRRSIPVLPYCPFVRRYIARHSEYLDLVPPDARAEFDLPAA